jgi:hypothetical protein
VTERSAPRAVASGGQYPESCDDTRLLTTAGLSSTLYSFVTDDSNTFGIELNWAFCESVSDGLKFIHSHNLPQPRVPWPGRWGRGKRHRGSI